MHSQGELCIDPYDGADSDLLLGGAVGFGVVLCVVAAVAYRNYRYRSVTHKKNVLFSVHCFMDIFIHPGMSKSLTLSSGR